MAQAKDAVFKEYQYRRASTDIADLIKTAILSDKFKAGDKLPAERNLATQFQVGRMTIREALRTLETKGLIAIRKGSSGGAFVQPAPPTQMAEMIIDNLQLDGVTFAEVAESRVVLERSIVKYVIEKATTEDLNEIEKNIEETKALATDPSPEKTRDFTAKSIEFHHLLAKSAHITPLLMFHSVMARWVLRRLIKTFNPGEKKRLTSTREHEAIFQAIVNKEISRCQDLMENHIRKVIKGIEKYA
ncbi:FadR/GntR family transcriptional regulator [Thermodesulfobacteriota bacterium]